MNRIHAAAAIASALCACAIAAPARAADGAWEHTVVLYGMGAALDGTAQIGDVEVPIDLSISDVFDSLEMGVMGAYRADNGTWSVALDATFMGLGATSETDRGLVKGDIDLDQMTLMGTVGYRLAERFEGLLSLGYFDLSTDLEVRTRNPLNGAVNVRKASEGASWVDPLIGLAYRVPFAEDWVFGLRGDIGGFGVGSDLTWHSIVSVRWQANDNFGVGFGYRVISFDYEDGRGADYERYDMVEQGPLIGVSYTF